MKKNKAMRAAGVLFVATMLSTSIVSGTYAKYVTSGTASDSARVAKFGVVVTASGSLFDYTYKSQAEGNTPGGKNADSTPFTSLTVEASENVIAPGTKSGDSPLTFEISGTPEVDVKVDIKVDTDAAKFEDVFLAAKDNLPNMTTGDKTDTFNNETTYYPIKYTLTADIIKNTSVTLTDTTTYGTVVKDAGTATGNLTQIAAVINAINGDGIYVDAGTDFSSGTNGIGDIKLTWAWDFDASGDGTYDKQDTLLGDLAANTTLTPATTLADGTDYNLDVKFNLTVSVTQVD